MKVGQTDRVDQIRTPVSLENREQYFVTFLLLPSCVCNPDACGFCIYQLNNHRLKSFEIKIASDMH